jgi:hypothetical protein
MSTPPISAIDLSSPSFNLTPPVSAIDLSTLTDPVSAAILDFTASGSGARESSQGQGAAAFSFQASSSALAGFNGSGEATLFYSVAGYGGFVASGSVSLSLSVAGSGFEDWVSLIPPIQLQEVYRLIITGDKDGASDLIVDGISGWQATSQADSRSSYLQATIPAATDLVSEIEARKNGDLVLQKGFRFSDGSKRYDELMRSTFDTIRSDRGPRAFTLTVSGYLSGKQPSNGTRTLSGIRSVSTSSGKRRVRCNIDMFLRPGMTVNADDISFKAGFINYYVSEAGKFCEIGER